MFYSRMERFDLTKPVTEIDRTGFESTGYKDSGSIRVYVVKKSSVTYHSNELNLINSEYVGFTQERVEVGDGIGGKYTVDYVVPIRTGYALSLSSWGESNE